MLRGATAGRRLLVVTAVLMSGMVIAGGLAPAQAVTCPTLMSQGDLTTQITVQGVDHVVHHFTTTGSAVFLPPPTVTSVEYLVVGGGGGGGARYGGGGGGGGVITGTLLVTPGVRVDVTVGAGGTGGVKRATGVSHGPGQNGGASTLGGLVASGGGGGGAGNQSTNSIGRTGASGGGGGGGPLDQSSVTFAGGGATQGHGGGAGTYGSAWNYFAGLTAGGGGGAGGPGGAGDRRSGVGLAGTGGAGVTSTVSGTSLDYGGGGGGGSFHVNAPNLGTGGGGNGTNTDTQPMKAVRGGGGGGGGLSTQGWDGSAGGDGGDGLVIVRYATPPLAPCAPLVTRVESGDGQVSVTFELPTSDGGAAITNYEYSTDGGVAWTAFAPTVAASPVVLGGLVNGTVSAVALRAVNVAGPGPASNIVYVTPVARPVVVLPPVTSATINAPSTIPASPSTTDTSPPAITAPSTITPGTAPVPPAPPPDDVVVTRDGVPVDATVLATEDAGLTLFHGETRLQVSARCVAVCPAMVMGDAGGVMLHADAGAQLLLSASGLRPGAAVNVWIFSTPQQLVRSVLDPSGSYVGMVSLSGVPPGRHTLQVNSVGPAGERLAFHVGLVIDAEPTTMAQSLPSTGGHPRGLMLALAVWCLALGSVLRRRSTLTTP